MSSETSRSPDPRLGNSTAQNAALQGASFAFAKPILKPKPQSNTYSGRDGALAAATAAGSPSPPRKSLYEGLDEPGLRYQSTGEDSSSVREGDLDRPRPTRLEPGNSSVDRSK